MSIIRSFVKTKERLQQEQTVIQIVKKASTESNEQKLLASSLLVPPQQSSSLRTFDYEAFIESMTNIEFTRSKGSYTKYTDVDRFQMRRYSSENGSKNNLILTFHFKNNFSRLNGSAVRNFRKQHQKELKKVRSQKWSPSKVTKAKKGERLFLIGGLDKMIQTLLRKHQISWWSSQHSSRHSSCQCFGWKTPRERTQSCTILDLYFHQKSVSLHRLCQTCWDDRKGRNSCRSKKEGGANIFAGDSQ